MATDSRTELIRRLRRQAGDHVKQARLLRDVADRLEAQRRTELQLAQLVQADQTSKLISAGSRQLTALSKTVINDSTPVSEPVTVEPVAPTPIQPPAASSFLKQPAPAAARLIREALASTSLPESVQDAISSSYPNGTKQNLRLILGGINAAASMLRHLKDHPEELTTAPTALRRFYEDLGLPQSWEKLDTLLKKWGFPREDAA